MYKLSKNINIFFSEHKIVPKTELDEQHEPKSTLTEDDDTPKIDLKLLLTPVVYTKKLDEMNVFRFFEYTNVKDKRVIEIADFESKPVDKKSFKVNDICDEKGLDVDKSTDTDADCFKEEQQLIKTTSWLFRKPRVKNYNPIQLCKNPDFNTRLKRLSPGFLSSPRNRQLLAQCKPLTVDVHKSFESKLVNDSLLLKKSYFLKAKETENEIVSVEKTVIPSEVPGQRLECIQDTTDVTSNPSTSTISQGNKSVDGVNVSPVMCPPERKKVISLPDIDQIRRANEKLLIAEVTPLLASNVTNIPPVTIVQENKSMEQNSQVDKDIKIEPELKVLDNATCTTDITVKDSRETENEDKSETNNESMEIVPSNMNIEKLSYYQKKKLGVKVRKVALSWTPKLMSTTVNNYPDDRLLARDTVERIINVCNGINMPLQKKYCYGYKKKCSAKKPLIKQADSLKCQELQTTNEENMPENPNEQQSEQINVQLSESNNVINKNDHVSQTQENDGNKKKRVRKRKKHNYCCWARAKLDYWNNKQRKHFRLPHECPQYKCICCCNFEYCDELRRRNRGQFLNIAPCLNLLSDDDSDHNVDKINESVNKLQVIHHQKLKQTPNIVDIGTNTDYDADFEKSYAENYAENLNNLNDCILSQPIISSVTSLAKAECSSNATQTYDFRDVTCGPEPRVTLPSTTDIPNMSETAVPLNTSIEATQLEVLLNKDTFQKIQPKCKTKICAPLIVPKILPLDQNVLKASSLELPNYNTSAIKVTSPNKGTVFNKKVTSNRAQKPITLGENKILLCSVKPLSITNMVDVTHLANNFTPKNANSIIDPTKLIPKGAHLVLLPNQELVVSVDPGTELDPTKITHLPAILASVQQQLFSAGIINQSPNSENRKTNDVVQLSDDKKESAKVDRCQDDSKIENLKMSSEIEVKEHISNFEEHIAYNQIIKINRPEQLSEFLQIHPKHSGFCNEIIKTNNSNRTSEDRFLNVLNSETVSPFFRETVSDLETNNTKTSEINEVTRDSETDASSEKVAPVNSISNERENNEVMDGSKLDQFTKDDLKETTAKKTILSDLMEMSGISLEDTANIETPLIQQPTLQPAIRPQEFITARLSLPSEIKGDRDNSLLSNIYVQAALVKYPDLHIVYSFEDLRYAYANNGQFYKMDTESGIIAPINVCIKKQMYQRKSKVRTMHKSVIDLTEDDIEDSKMSTLESKSEENKDTSDVSQNNAKPIKLFKNIHPSILKRNLKTFSEQPKRFRTPNLKRKKDINLINQDNIDESKRTKYAENEKTNTNSDSDDEPLSLKAKRIRTILEDQSKNVDENVGENIENYQEMQIMQSNYEEVNFKTFLAKVPTQNQPEDIDSNLREQIVFQFNNEESSDEDCILGV